MIAPGGRGAIFVEHLGPEDERPAVDHRLRQLLAEPSSLPLLDADPGPLGPRLRRGSGIHQDGRHSGSKHRIERSLGEHVVGAQDCEQRFAGHRRFRGGQRGSVAQLPVIRPDHGDALELPRRPFNHLRLEARNDHDLLHARLLEGAHGPLDQGGATQNGDRLRSTSGDRGQSLGASGGEDHADAGHRARPPGGMRRGEDLGGELTGASGGCHHPGRIVVSAAKVERAAGDPPPGLTRATP